MDRYTKMVLTIIAVALSIIALRLPGPTALALSDGCGSITDPCYVDSKPVGGIEVYVTNLK